MVNMSRCFLTSKPTCIVEGIVGIIEWFGYHEHKHMFTACIEPDCIIYLMLLVAGVFLFAAFNIFESPEHNCIHI